MKLPLFVFSAAAALLLGACNNQNSADQAATGSAAAPADEHAGHQHVEAANAGDAATTSLTGAMAKMMQQMHAEKPNGNKDHDFAHHMMAHHQGAVDMAAVLLKEGQDPTLRRMAEKITADQRWEIKELAAAAMRLDHAPRNYDPSNPQDPFQAGLTASMQPMMAPMTPTGNVDRDFATMMVAHHQSAVDMAKLEVAQGTDAELKKMAQQMIDAQQREIQQFNDWLKQHANQQ